MIEVNFTETLRDLKGQPVIKVLPDGVKMPLTMADLLTDILMFKTAKGNAVELREFCLQLATGKDFKVTADLLREIVIHVTDVESVPNLHKANLILHISAYLNGR